MIPYIDGTPAGTPRRADVIWLGEMLYVDELPKAKLAKRVPEEIGKAFNRADVKAALDYSFGRSSEDVREYLEENFHLSGSMEAPPVENEQDASTTVAAKSTLFRDSQNGFEKDIAAPDESQPTIEGAEPVENDEQSSTIIEATDNEQDGLHRLDEIPARQRTMPKPYKPSVIERFAKALGFEKDNDQRFFREDGSWIGRANGTRFPWERRDASGDLERFYWPKDHCLEREPLQLEADVWALIDQLPDKYALILLDIEGAPVEVTGAGLRRMRDAGEITLYPATYRIVYGHDQHV
jgi:hypothetical protein